jgi:ribonuclease R
VLLKARAKRGAIDFETTETRMIFDDNGKIAQIVPESAQRCPSPDRGVHARRQRVRLRVPRHREHPALYRVHDSPSEDKLAKLREFLKEFGLQLRRRR